MVKFIELFNWIDAFAAIFVLAMIFAGIELKFSSEFIVFSTLFLIFLYYGLLLIFGIAAHVLIGDKQQQNRARKKFRDIVDEKTFQTHYAMLYGAIIWGLVAWVTVGISLGTGIIQGLQVIVAFVGFELIYSRFFQKKEVKK